MCHAGFGGVDALTRRATTASSRRSAAATAGASRATAPTRCRRTARTPRTRPVEETELNYPVRVDAALARRGLGGRRAASAAGSGCARTSSSTGRRRSPCSPTARCAGPRARFGGHDGRVGRVRARPRRRRDAARARRRRSSCEAGDTISYRTCGGGGYGPPSERDPERVRRDVREGKVSAGARDDGARRGRDGGGRRVTAIDPITFEVIRNALVAATDEMVLALKRSAYSTNIKTRSDFSCAFFDAELRSVAQGFAQPVHLGSMVEQVPKAVLAYGPENLGPGDVIVTNDPYPSGVHLNDVSLISPVHWDGELLGYVANLAHHVDVGGGAPASIGAFREVFQEGVIIPPVKLVAGGAIVDDVFRLILAQIRSKHETAGDFRAQIAANATGVRRVQALVDAARPRDDPRDDGGAARVHRAPHARRDRRAAVRRLRGRGLGRQRRLHRRARAPEGAHRDRAGRRQLRHDGLRPAAPRARQLDVRDDVLGLRVRAQVPDRPRSAGERRLLPRRLGARARGHGHELHVARARSSAAGRRRPARRRLLPRAPPRVPRAAARGHEGDDVPGGLRLARRRRPRPTPASTTRSRAATAGASRATAPTRCRRTARTPRTRRSRRPS